MQATIVSAYQTPSRSANSRRPLATLGLILASMACAACARSDSDVPPGSLVVGFETAPTALDPRYATDEKSSLLGDLLYRGLTRIDQLGEPVLDLAESLRVLENRRYVFRLRAGVTFHDGSPVTTADVKATYESVLDPAMASPKRASLSMIERIDIPNERTVIFTLGEPHAPFLNATGLGILPAAALKGSNRRVTVGCGPFRLIRFRRDTDILVTATDTHPRDPPRLPAIVFKIVPDDTVRVLELARGDIHLLQNAVDPDMIPWLRKQNDIEVLSVPGTTFHYLGMNLRDPHLRHLSVRKAIALGIDRHAIIQHLLGGLAVPATGLLSPTNWAYTADVPTYAYDPARARALLDEAGFEDPDGGGPRARFHLLYKGSMQQGRRRFAEVLQEQLARIGITLDIRTYEWGTLYADIRSGNFQLYALAWVGVSDPDIYYSLFHSEMIPPRGNNRGGYADPEIDRLTVLGRRTTDRRRRREIYHAVQRRLAATLPMIPLWWARTVVAKTRRLRGFTPRPDGGLESLRDAWLVPKGSK